jgi:hypothetical protein
MLLTCEVSVPSLKRMIPGRIPKGFCMVMSYEIDVMDDDTVIPYFAVVIFGFVAVVCGGSLLLSFSVGKQLRALHGSNAGDEWTGWTRSLALLDYCGTDLLRESQSTP